MYAMMRCDERRRCRSRKEDVNKKEKNAPNEFLHRATEQVWTSQRKVTIFFWMCSKNYIVALSTFFCVHIHYDIKLRSGVPVRAACCVSILSFADSFVRSCCRHSRVAFCIRHNLISDKWMLQIYGVSPAVLTQLFHTRILPVCLSVALKMRNI